jgi:cardiolipin synthase
MTMYILSDDDTVNALVAQAKAGREVQVVLNKNLPSGSNAQVYSTLQSGGVAVHWSSSKFTYTHEKCVILDGTEAWIMTMNADYSAPRDNREYLAIDDQPADVAEAEAVFAPINAHADLLSLAASARTSIDIEAEELSDDKIVSALTTAAKSGVTVRVVLSDVARDSTEVKALTALKAGGVHVVQLSMPYVHAKSMVVDGTTAYVGSENFTYDSLEDNRELGLIFAIPSEVSKIVTTTAQDFAAGTPL